MAVPPGFYNQVDQDIYRGGNYFVPQEQYRLNYTPPVIETEEQESSFGLPNSNSFKNFSNRDNNNFNTGNLQPYTAQPSESFVTNRTDLGFGSGYLPGTEPEETYMDKVGGLIRTGIGMAIPGGNFLMNMAGKLNRFDDLDPRDQAFIEMQKGIDERSVHNIGNLPNQDRYGYNKVSMLGNYSELVKKRADMARKWQNDPRNAGKKLLDIHQYYLEKEKEQDDVNKQIDFNNEMRRRSAIINFQKAKEKGIKIFPTPTDVHDTPAPAPTPTPAYDYAGRDTDFGTHTSTVSNKQAQENQDRARGNYFFRGGLVSL